MPLYRKKPVVIEAHKFNDGNVYEVGEWCGGVVMRNYSTDEYSIVIHTMEGDMRADAGDWIIKGVNGEFYPCKPDIFDKTYEPA